MIANKHFPMSVCRKKFFNFCTRVFGVSFVVEVSGGMDEMISLADGMVAGGGGVGWLDGID